MLDQLIRTACCLHADVRNYMTKHGWDHEILLRTTFAAAQRNAECEATILPIDLR